MSAPEDRDKTYDELVAEKKNVEDRNKRRREQEINDLKKVLGHVEGRRFVWRILSDAGVFRTSFNQNALTMAFSEGNRNLGLLFLNEIMQFSPNSFSQMQREYVSDLKSQRKEI